MLVPSSLSPSFETTWDSSPSLETTWDLGPEGAEAGGVWLSGRRKPTSPEEAA